MDILVKLAVAAVLGGMIGLERDIHGRAAGLRTHIMVSMGSALFMIISLRLYEIYALAAANPALRVDPGRVAAQIVTGIGFLGAGAVLKSGVNIRGLTTAGCIWVSAGIGMASGLAYYMPAVITVVIALAVLVLLNKLEKVFYRDSYRTLKVRVHTRDNVVSDLIDRIKGSGVDVVNCEYTRDIEMNTTDAVFSIKVFHKGSTDKKSHDLIGRLENDFEGIKTIAWERGKYF